MGFRRSKDTGIAHSSKDLALHDHIEKEAQEELDAHLEPEPDAKPRRFSKPSKPESKPHDHKKAHRPIKPSDTEPSYPEPSRQSQPYFNSHAKAYPKSPSGSMFADIDAPDRLSDTATSAITALILLCVFLFWGWRYQVRQRTLRAEKEIAVIIGDICSMSSIPLHPSPFSRVLFAPVSSSLRS
jgi:hypothetical protein